MEEFLPYGRSNAHLRKSRFDTREMLKLRDFCAALRRIIVIVLAD